MKRTRSVQLAAALAGVVTLASAADSLAQDTSLPVGRPRSADERVVTGSPTPPPVNSDYRKAAEGQLPIAPPPGVLVPRAIRPGEAADPATRLQPAVVAPGAPLSAPAGLDVAMLVEHAVGMAIEGSALQAIAEQGGAESGDPSKTLLDHARKQMAESKALLTQAGADGRNVEAGSPTRRFYAAANNYLATLGALSTPAAPASPSEKSQVALINHSVKEVLDSGHIRQFGRAYSSSAATEQLMNHARDMHDGGMQAVLRLAGNGTTDPSAPATPTLLAQRGRELLDAAEQLAALVPRMASPTRLNVTPANVLSDEPNPGRLTDPNADIIGGTQATGSQTVGTVTGPNVTKGASNVIPSQGGEANTRPTGGQAGSRPK